MKYVVLCCFLLVAVGARCQTNSTELFGTDELLNLKLSGDITSLLNDRGDKSQYHPLLLSYTGKDSIELTLNITAKTRGHFRRRTENCFYPPILLHFEKEGKKHSLFTHQKKLKLVVPCRGDNYIIREYLVYKLYNLLTPMSYKARLVRVTLYNTVKKKQTAFYGMLLEEEEQMAKRNGVKIIDKKMLRGENTETETFLKMAVFQYMIGNTDWSVPYLHNIHIIAFDSLSIPSVVAYDFDFSGIVNSFYATPSEELELKSVQERRYRGYCITDIKTFDAVIAVFNQLRNEFYKVYTTCPLLEPKYVAATTRYLDDFYQTINNPEKLKAAFGYPCHNNTPNIVIKGLDKDK